MVARLGLLAHKSALVDEHLLLCIKIAVVSEYQRLLFVAGEGLFCVILALSRTYLVLLLPMIPASLPTTDLTAEESSFFSSLSSTSDDFSS